MRALSTEKITSKRNNKIYRYFIRRYKKDTYNYNHFKRIINDQEVLLTNEDSEIKRIYDANLDDTGRTGVKAILTAFDKYGTGAGYQKVMNLWGGRVANSLAKSISQNFTKSALIIWGTTAATYGLSYGLGQIDWGF